MSAKDVYARKAARKQAISSGQDTYSIDGGTYTTGLTGGAGGKVSSTRGKAVQSNTGSVLGASTDPNVSTTTISNANKIDYIPTLNNNLNTLSDKGITTDNEGNPRYADGSFYQESDTQDNTQKNNQESSVEADTSNEDTQTARLLKQMQTSTDAQTKAQLDNIQQKFDLRKQQQEKINSQATKQIQNALLTGGVTGQGSSAQYAPISSVGIVQAQESYGLQQLATLDSQEQDLIAQAKSAQADQNYRLMETKLAEIKDKRQEKLDAAAKLNEQIAKRNEEALKQQEAMSRDTAINDIYNQGITDTGAILKELKKQGVTATAKDVGDTVALLSGVGGSGVIGTYNLYASQARSKGQVPMDFLSFQRANYNATHAGTGGGTPGTGGGTGPVTFKALTEAQGKDFTYAQRGDNAKDIISSLSTEIATMNPGKYQTQVILEKNNLTSPNVSDTIRQVRQAERDFATAILRRESGAAISNSEFATVEKQYFPRPGDDAKTLKQKEELRKTAINSFKANVPNYNERLRQENGEVLGASTDLIQQGEEAKNLVNTFVISHPKDAPTVNKLYGLGWSDIKIQEYLKANGKI